MANSVHSARLEAVSAGVVAKLDINPRAALRSALRSWLVYRDRAVWCLVSGADAESGDPILDKIDLTPALPAVEKMNVLRDMAYDLAAQVDERRAEAVLRSELEILLSEEKPRFILAADGAPGSF